MTIEQTVFDMMTTSTGTHMLDSGGANGRHWQRNQERSIEHFLSEPEAVLSTEYDYSGSYRFTISQADQRRNLSG